MPQTISEESAPRPALPWHILEHDAEADRDALEQLCDQLESFSPIVGIEAIEPDRLKQGYRPSSILLDITGLAALFGSERQLVQQQQKHLETEGYLARVAVADTVGAAWGLARFLAGKHFRQHAEPLRTRPGDRNLQELLPVAALRLETSIVDMLGQLGIGTIGQLQQLSRSALATRFGPTLHRRLDQLDGKLEEPVQARRKPGAFASDQLLEHPTHHRETIEVIIARLVTQLCQRLRGQQQGSLEWTIQLSCQQGAPIEFQVKLFQPTAIVEHIMPLVEMQLEQVLSSVTRQSRRRKIRYTTIEVIEIRVLVSSHVLLAQQQRLLFDDTPRLDRQALSHLINRLASRLGTENVVYPTLQSGAQPEYSFRLKPLVDATRRRRRQTAEAKQQSHTIARPLRLFHPPLPLEPVLQASTSVSPARQRSCPQLTMLKRREVTASRRPFSAAGQFRQPAQAIVANWGPERIETGWWRGRTVCRDYWRVETESGQHYWVFRSLRTGQWWLHGEF